MWRRSDWRDKRERRSRGFDYRQFGHNHSVGLWGQRDGIGFERRGGGEQRLGDGAGEFEPDADRDE